MDEQV
jgi:hypothetical protein